MGRSEPFYFYFYFVGECTRRFKVYGHPCSRRFTEDKTSTSVRSVVLTLFVCFFIFRMMVYGILILNLR